MSGRNPDTHTSTSLHRGHSRCRKRPSLLVARLVMHVPMRCCQPESRARHPRLCATTVKTPDGKKLRLYGTSGVPGPYQDLAATKIGAQEAEQRAIKHAFAGVTAAATPPVKKEVPTLDEWFHGRFWTEWVIGRQEQADRGPQQAEHLPAAPPGAAWRQAAR